MMNEETTTQTQQLSDPETQAQTQAQTQETRSSEVITTDSSHCDYSEGFPINSDNEIHKLFLILGVDLDYVPQNDYQVFTMALQFAAALWFIWWLIKYLFTFIRGICK